MKEDTLRPQYSESLVIGSILVRGIEGLDDAKRFLTANDFSHGTHTLIFIACESLAEMRRTITPANVLAHLLERGKAEELGADAGGFLLRLHDSAGVGLDIDYHAPIVAEAARRRAIEGIASQALNQSRTMSAEELAAQIRHGLSIVEGTAQETLRPFAEAMREAVEAMNDRTRPGFQSELTRTGLKTLDDETAGGFAPGELVILAARPGRGKTAMLLQLTRQFADDGAVPVLFSLEMRARENAARVLAAESRTSTRLFRGAENPSTDEVGRILMAYERLAGGALSWIDDSPEATAAKITSTARRCQRNHSTRVVLVDYLQLLRPANPKESRHLQVGQMAREMKLLARNLGIVVVCAAQLNREVEGRPDPTPRLSDLRDSGEIEQHADFVFFLHGKADTQHMSEETIRLICGKGRSVAAGYELALSWNKPRMTFTEAIGY